MAIMVQRQPARPRRSTGATRSRRVRWNDALFLTLIAYVMVFPWGNNQVLIPLLGISAALGGVRWLLQGGSRPGDPRVGLIGISVAGILPLCMGILDNTPGAIDVGIALVAGPVAWFLISYLPGTSAIDLVPKVISYVSLFIAVCVIATGLGFDVPVLSTVYPRTGGAILDGESRVHSPLVGTLLVTVPISLFHVVRDTVGRSQMRQWADGLSLMFGALAVALSGRQALVLVVVATPLFIVLISRWLPSRASTWLSLERLGARWFRIFLWLSLTLFSAGVAASLVGIDLLSIPRNLLASVGAGEAQAERVARGFSTRSRQQASLLRGWREQPIFGHGSGAIVSDRHTWRDQSFVGFTPWRAELQYHLLLFETGIIGIAMYAIAVRSGLARLKRAAQTWSSRLNIENTQALLVGATGFMIATASNPYLRGVGRQWILMLPLAMVAFGKAQAKSSNDSVGPPKR